MLEQSALDGWLRDTERDPAERPASDQNGPSRRSTRSSHAAAAADAVGLGHRHLRICPLKYKFARVFRIPQEPTIYQRFGIVVHQVLERFHGQGGGSLGQLMELFEAPGAARASATRTTSSSSASAPSAALESYWQVTATRTRRRSGSSARSRSRSGRTCCAAAWTAWTAIRTVPTS